MAKQEHRISAGHLWNPSYYYVGTASDVTEDVIGKYIEIQRTRPRERVRK